MSNWDDDDALMADLAQATAESRAVTDRAREAARAAFAWRTIDEELMALAHDSLSAAGSLVRAADTARVVSFEGRGFSVELEIAGEQVMGQVVPGRACVVAVLAPDGSSQRVEVDPSGFFVLEGVGRGPRRFSVELDGQTQTSPWVVL